jgi:hypothetical protein
LLSNIEYIFRGSSAGKPERPGGVSSGGGNMVDAATNERQLEQKQQKRHRQRLQNEPAEHTATAIEMDADDTSPEPMARRDTLDRIDKEPSNEMLELKAQVAYVTPWLVAIVDSKFCKLCA